MRKPTWPVHFRKNQGTKSLKEWLKFLFYAWKKASSDYNKLFDPFNEGLFLRLEKKLGIRILFHANGPLYLV